MNIIHPEINFYLQSYSSHLSAELEALEKETYQKVLLPHMISGADQGRFLYQFTSALKPQRVLELGTFTGYSAICIASALEEDASLITLDINEEIAWLPLKYFTLCGLDTKIEFIIESGIDYIPKLDDSSVEMVFIDADKKNYPVYYELLKPKLKSGGFLLVDNVLWHGKILDTSTTNKDTLAIKELTKKLFEDSDFVCSILPIRDGILLARKR